MILVTNDDGVDSRGLMELARAVSKVDTVAVVAPTRNWTAAGHTKTLDRPLRATETLLPGSKITALACDGSPSDCVALAFLGLLPQRPRLVVAGVNKGSNLSSDVTYSGTVSAAMEGVVCGVPSIAVSLAQYANWDFRAAAGFAARLCHEVLHRGVEADVLLNVNVPPGPRVGLKGVRVTRLGKRKYQDELVHRTDPFGRSYYWIGGLPLEGQYEEGTDLHAVEQGFISVTPILMDLTNHHLLEAIELWRLKP